MDRATAATCLRQLGLSGANLVVHASLRECGLRERDATDLCLALLDAVGPAGTIVMPAFTSGQTIVEAESTPQPFHPDLPVGPEIGPVSEAFRKLPGVLRSSHPSHSFCAWGRHAHEVLSTNRDNNPLGPIKKLNVVSGLILLLGAPLRDCVAIHLSEELLPAPYLGRATATRINLAGYEERVVIEKMPGCGRAFDRLEPLLEPEIIGRATFFRGMAHVLPMRTVIRIATAALAATPDLFICERGDCGSCTTKRAKLE
jgi:aminoglycoside 3-N-acetyltransferase